MHCLPSKPSDVDMMGAVANIHIQSFIKFTVYVTCDTVHRVTAVVEVNNSQKKCKHEGEHQHFPDHDVQSPCLLSFFFGLQQSISSKWSEFHILNKHQQRLIK